MMILNFVKICLGTFVGSSFFNLWWWPLMAFGGLFGAIVLVRYIMSLKGAYL